jgi:Xaa-Pro aminopeptidase
MFDPKIYAQRRKLLRHQLQSGLILFLGHDDSPMNYAANTYEFRQDSSFLYFFGLDSPGLAGVVDVDENKDALYGNDIDLEDIIWMGFLPKLKERAAKVGVKETAPLDKLAEKLKQAKEQGRYIHYLPPYRAETSAKIEQWLGISAQEAKAHASEELIKAVVSQRSIKIKEEIAEINKAFVTTYEMYLTAMKMTKPGLYEREIVGRMEGMMIAQNCFPAFPTILTINGQILHSHYHGNLLKKGRLLIIDAGAESPLHYASDITRTIPVSGRFTPEQKEIYELVLASQMKAIQLIKPGIPYRDVHLEVARVIASGLKDLGLMRGDVEEAVGVGAHALFFPHGLGHMLGLDVHDMEGLGENYVGYTDKIRRSDQFGLAYLRLARELEPGFVVTVEPGIYFIPALIDQWQKEKKFKNFINYEKVEQYKNFGGVRIEDDVLVTAKGHRVLGQSIPKTIKDVESVTGKGK